MTSFVPIVAVSLVAAPLSSTPLQGLPTEPPGALKDTSRPFPTPKIARLKNGLQVAVVERPWMDLELVRIELVVRGGVSSEPSKRSGMSFIAFQTLAKAGGLAHPGGLHALELMRLNAFMEARTAYDWSSLALTGPVRNLERELSLMASTVIQPSFDDSVFDSILSRTYLYRKAEERRDELSPDRQLDRALFGTGHPFSRDPRGASSHLSGLGVQHLLRYHRDWVRPGNAMLIVSGPVRTKPVRRLVERVFGRWSPSRMPRIKVRRPSGRAGTATIGRRRSKDEDTWVCVGSLVPNRNPQFRSGIEVLTEVLGGSFDSLLHQELRHHEGYTYTVRAQVDWHLNTGVCSVCLPVDKTREGSAIADLVNALDAFPERLNEASIRIAEHRLEQMNLLQAADLTTSTLTLKRRFLGHHLTDRPLKLLQVKRLAETYFSPKNLQLLVLSDNPQVQRQVKEAGFALSNR